MLFFIIHLIISSGKFGAPYLGKATAASRTGLPSPTSACLVFSCFRNRPNSDMDYRSFNVRTWPFLCVHIHTGVGHTDSQSAQHLWLGKTLTNRSCAPDGIRTSGLWISSPTLYPLSHPAAPLWFDDDCKEAKQSARSSLDVFKRTEERMMID